MPRYKLRTLLFLMAIGPPMVAAIYLAPVPTFAFLIIVGSAVFTVVRRWYESWKSATTPLRKRLKELEPEIEKSTQSRPT